MLVISLLMTLKASSQHFVIPVAEYVEIIFSYVYLTTTLVSLSFSCYCNIFRCLSTFCVFTQQGARSELTPNSALTTPNA
ncbi:hypothetical protein [Nostoc sp. C117]|uniref:hypothetical protein n=1 Tax=Nostoc sp. C117 TaxID=3349875 RepID=UPI00370D99F0